jgi:hypothetical protein
MSSLKQNEYLPKVTFENFLNKKTKKGKRTIFMNKEPGEDAKSYMKEYMQQA